MNYVCLISRTGDGNTIEISMDDWSSFARRIEARYPVNIRVRESDRPQLCDVWLFEAAPSLEPSGLDMAMVREISTEIDRFLESRKRPLPRTA